MGDRSQRATERRGTPGTLRLEILRGEGPAPYEMEPGGPPVTIGRGRDENVFVVRDSSVSRRHAVIEYGPDGYRVRDLKSLNGVKLHGRPVPADGAVLADGDELHLGVTVLRVGITAVGAEDDAPDTVIDLHPPDPPKPPPRPVAKPAEPPPRRERASRAVRARPETIERFGPFEVYRQLAPGSGQRLDLAHDTRTDSDVTLLRVQASDVGFFARRRFRRAHEQARAIEHDNLLAPLEVGQEQNELYVRYPAIDGISAEQLLRDAGRDLRVDGAVLVVRELCRGLDHLAATVGAGFRPVVSDRLVLVGREGRVVLTVVADPAGGAQADRYLAPEEDAGGRGDARSAVFSAGILLYELLAREAIEPGRKLTLPSVDTVRIQVPPGLAATTMRAVEVRPEDRFPSAGELERALDEELSALAPRFAERDLAEWLAGRFPA